MVRSLKFSFAVAAQLLAPAALYLCVGLYNGRTTGLEYLPQNHLFMAAPHLLVALSALSPSLRRPALLWLLTLLNSLLIAFQLWVLLAVPPRESGLAWVLYIPLWLLALLTFSACTFVLAQRQRTVANKSVDT